MSSPQLKDSKKKNTNSILKLYHLLTPFFKSTQMQLQKTKHKSVNIVIRQKSIGIRTCLPCQHEIKHAVKHIFAELV